GYALCLHPAQSRPARLRRHGEHGVDGALLPGEELCFAARGDGGGARPGTARVASVAGSVRTYRPAVRRVPGEPCRKRTALADFSRGTGPRGPFLPKLTRRHGSERGPS